MYEEKKGTDYIQLNPYIYYVVNVDESSVRDPLHGFAPRTTQAHELEFIIKGKGKMITNGKDIFVESGDLLYRPPNTSMHAFGDYHCYLIIFEPIADYEVIQQRRKICNDIRMLGNEMIRNPIQTDNPMISDYSNPENIPLNVESVIRVNEEQQIGLLFKELLIAFGKYNQKNNLNIKILLLQIIEKVFEIQNQHQFANNASANVMKYVDDMMELKKSIDNDPAKPYQLETVARDFGLSKHYFSRMFKEIIGINISAYYIEARLNLAKELLLTTSLPIEQIALETGFETTTYFYRSFKSQMRITPKRYREQFRYV